VAKRPLPRRDLLAEEQMSVTLALFGAAITVVFTRGSLFEKLRGGPQRAREAESRIVRFFRDLVTCPLCCGVWIGSALSVLHDYGGHWDVVRAVDVLGFGCASAVLALALYSLLDWLQAPHWEVPAMGQTQIQPIVMPMPVPQPVQAPPVTPQKPPAIPGG
jgi:hypothetical protein